MARKQTPNGTKVHVYPTPPKHFDPFAATEKDLMKHGLPLRPDARTQPRLAALWERLAARYRSYDHLELKLPATTEATPTVAPFDLAPIESCGYQLLGSSVTPFTALSLQWTVPDLQYTSSQLGVDYFHTFAGLGFLDLHVEMTVDSAQNVTCQLWAQAVGNINLPVRPGDLLSASICLQTNQAGTASYFLANQTTAQTINFSVATGYPPAVEINAGVTRSWPLNQPDPPLARFGAVYFDEIEPYSTNGFQSLTSGQAITMVDQNNRTLAEPAFLTSIAFKALFISA